MKFYDPSVTSPVLGPDATTLLSHATYFDDFFEGGWVKDLALSSESEPSGGKFSNHAESAAWNVSFHSGTDGVSTDEVIQIANSADNGILEINTDADDDDVMSMQLNGEGFKLSAGRTIVYETRISVDDADTIDLFMGLGIDDVLPITAISDYMGFGIVDGDASLQAVSGKDSTGEAIVTGNGTTLTDTGIDFEDGTATTKFLVLRMVATGSKVQYFSDGVLVATHTTSIPDDEHMTPTLSIRNGSSAVSKVFIDYIFCTQNR
jgi:hypothetical protein